MKKKIKLLGLTFLVLAISLIGFNASFAQGTTTYTLADVATHNTSTDCWVAISGNVYNLTAFIPLHPGGSAAIIGLCGTDGTAALSAAPHGLSVVPTIAQYMIGTLTTSTTTTPVLTSVTVTSASSSITVGGTSQLSATPKDQNGSLFVGATTTFASSNTSIATVDSNTGLVTGVANGTVTITATSVSGSVSVTGTTTITIGSTTVGGGGENENEGVENENEGGGTVVTPPPTTTGEHENEGSGSHHTGGGSGSDDGSSTTTSSHSHQIDD
jgi:uncharacterized protein YjdB